MADSSVEPRASGIYEIVNTVNGKRYVGSAKNFKTRWTSHRSQLTLGKHHSVALQRAWVLYRPASFSFRVVLFCAPANLLLYEQICIDSLEPEYNICPIAGSSLGRVTGDSTKRKLSIAITGKKRSDETRARLSQASRARVMPPMSDETKAKISAANRGRKRPPRSQAHSAKLAAAKRKFSHAQVVEIRRLLADGCVSQQAIANQFNCSAALICLIASGKSYRGVGR